MQWNLVGDIGGTNARLALVPNGASDPQEVQNFSSAEFSSFEGVIDTYLRQNEVQTKIGKACLAVASPVTGDHIQFTNNPWKFSIAALKSRFAWQELHVINDFEAIARSLPCLDPAALRPIGRQRWETSGLATKAVIGPGTGLGMAALLPTPDGGWIPLPTEGGHAGFCPTTRQEFALLEHSFQQQGFLCWEDLLSGQGLVRLWQMHMEMHGQSISGELPSPAEITHAGLQGGSGAAIYREVMDLFCSLLGNVAGNFALQTGATGGVYIAGGIIPRFPDFFAASGFRSAFESKGAYQDYLAEIPTYLIEAKQPGLVGAAAALIDRPKGGLAHA